MDRKIVNFSILGFAVTRVLPASGLLALMVLLAVLWGCQKQSPLQRLSPQIRPVTQISRLVKNAQYLRKSGRLELAVEELEEARLQEPDNLEIIDLLARCYEELGYFDRAQELYEEALSQAGHHGALENNRCYSLYLQGRLNQAESCFRKILAREPNNQTARNNLGLVLCRQGREAEALALWREALNEAETRQLLGKALIALGREVPPTIAGQPLVAGAQSRQATKEQEVRLESKLSSPPSPLDLSASRGQSTKTSSLKHPELINTNTPEASAVVAPLSNSGGGQTQLSSGATTSISPSLFPVSPQPAVQTPKLTSATEINLGSRRMQKPIAPQESAALAAGFAYPDRESSPLPEEHVAQTSLDLSESLSTSKMEVAAQTPAPSQKTNPELSATRFAGAAAPVPLTASAAEREKEAAPPAAKPPIKKNLQASTSDQPAPEAKVAQQGQPLRQFLTRLVRLLTREESAARASVSENNKASTPIPKANEIKEAQASAAPPVTVATASSKQQDELAAASSPSGNEDNSIPVLTSRELRKTRIELKNGNGVQNLARNTRRLLSLEGFTVVAIGNHIDFGLEETVIAYRPEAARVARVLAQKFFPEAKLEANGKTSRGADIRVSLGRGLAVAQDPQDHHRENTAAVKSTPLPSIPLMTKPAEKAAPAEATPVASTIPQTGTPDTLAARTPHQMRIELRNGNGVPGQARKIRTRLARPRLQRVKYRQM